MINLPNFSKPKILVIGDVILDRYWVGSADRISPEAPVPIVHVKDEKTSKPGGAANVALNIASLSANCTVMGAVGQDNNGTLLKEAIVKASVKPKLLTVKKHATITKIRILSQHQQLIRLDFENAFDKAISKSLIDKACQRLDDFDLIICSDYAKGVLTEIKTLVKVARQKKIPILIDPKSDDFSLYKGATMLTPNFKEFQAAFGHCSNEAALVKKARDAIVKYNLQALLVTRGAKGMSLVQKEGQVVHLPAHARDVFDVTGAGDTVIGVLGACIAAGADFASAAKLANLAAGIVVKKVGTGSVTIHELRRAIQYENNAHLGVLTQSQLKQAVIDAKAHGEVVVMTNGCFDILHAGHIEYLQQAKALGDRLIIAVNDNDSVQRLKGKSRPLKDIAERMEILASLRPVDWVVSFSEDTPERLISEILPNILVKGGDYKNVANTIAGAKAVKANGGQVKILNFKTGFSTTAFIKKLKEQ
jgi:D-beta-D-heptose 7-phosphate kinase/D-beta-D-heptose 1-phosphate adenosyltransferase